MSDEKLGIAWETAPPQLVPDEDLRLVIVSLMEELQRQRVKLNLFDRTGELRRSYERFACALRASGFRLNETLEKHERARRERRLGELAEQRGDVDAAILHFERAVASWSTVGCRRRLTYLKRR